MLTLVTIWIINAVTLMIVAYILEGFDFANVYAAFIAVLVLGFVNAIIRPIVLLLTLPINIFTLGLFTFVINALMLWFVSSVVKGFEIDSFQTALIAALLLWAMSFVTNVIANQVRRTHRP